jgi:hypothetical protein
MKACSCLATNPNAQTHDPADREQLLRGAILDSLRKIVSFRQGCVTRFEGF